MTVAVLFLCALLSGGLMAAVAGLLVGVPSLRLKGDYLAIVTLGFGEIIRVIFRNIESLAALWGLPASPRTRIFSGVQFRRRDDLRGHVHGHSTYGRGFIAVHDDEVAAEAMGINSTKRKIIAFVVGAFFAGIAGGIYGHFKLSLIPKGFDFIKSIEIVVMVILGGMGNTVGVIIAAVLLTLLPECLRGFAQISMMLYSLLLVILMLTRPQGLHAAQAGAGRKKDHMTPGGNAPLLQLQNCTIRFGGLTAVSALDLEIGPRELIGLIGPNGAGKTTVFNIVTGVYRPTEGEISFAEFHCRQTPYQITAHGIAGLSQNIRLFRP